MVPTLNREQFEKYLKMASSFAVWVQVCPALQRLVTITKEQAIDIGYDGLNFGPIWGMFSQKGCLEISLTSQWLDRLKDG